MFLLSRFPVSYGFHGGRAYITAAVSRPSVTVLAPVFPGAGAPQVIELMRSFGVRRCFYGHLHGASVRSAVQGMVDGLEYRLISADALRFCPYKI